MTDERGTLHPKIAQTAGARLFNMNLNIGQDTRAGKDQGRTQQTRTFARLFKVSFTSFRRPYLTGRATIGRLDLPPGVGRFVCEPPT